MNQTEMFASLGAPLVNSRWSWGSVRAADGAVFLRTWADRIRPHAGGTYVQVARGAEHVPNPNKLGYRERLRQVGLVRGGAPCFLIMCEAVDVAAVPRRIRHFSREEVIPGGRLAEVDGDWLIEMLPPVPVSQAMPPSLPPAGAAGEHPIDGPEEGFLEGRELLLIHRRKERNRKAVRRKKECVLATTGALVCEACDFDFAAAYGPLGCGFAECHHRVALGSLTEEHRVRLSELAIVCANCHRMLHRRTPLTVEGLRKIVEAQRTDRLTGTGIG